jgi:hypothetical protein
LIGSLKPIPKPEKKRKKKEKEERIKKREKDALHYLIKPPSSTLH